MDGRAGSGAASGAGGGSACAARHGVLPEGGERDGSGGKGGGFGQDDMETGRADGDAPALTPSAFAALMAPLGPWGSERRVAVAVSGGADSLCLALLLAGWGRPYALIVDHGLRSEAAAEAALAAARCAAFGVPAKVLRLSGLAGGAGVQARARRARYAALEAACRALGLTDLLLGHHAADQAETLLLRREDGSGPAGLAGMAAVVAGDGVRRVRPLLDVPPGRLRATLQAAGLGWSEDPSNADQRFARVRWRGVVGGAVQDLAAAARVHGLARAAAEQGTAAFLARHAEIRPEGFAILDAVDFPVAALGALMRALGGADYAPAAAGVAALAAAGRHGTLGGMRLLPAGRAGRREPLAAAEAWPVMPGCRGMAEGGAGGARLLVRELAALGPAVPLRAEAVWDGRFAVSPSVSLKDTALEGLMLGALGADAARFRRARGLPACVLAALPALRRGGRLVAVPHLGVGWEWTNPPFRLRLKPSSPVAGAAFQVSAGGS